MRSAISVRFLVQSAETESYIKNWCPTSFGCRLDILRKRKNTFISETVQRYRYFLAKSLDWKVCAKACAHFYPTAISAIRYCFHPWCPDGRVEFKRLDSGKKFAWAVSQ